MMLLHRQSTTDRRRVVLAACAAAVVVLGAGGAVAYAATTEYSAWPPAKAARATAQQTALAKARAHPFPKSDVGAPPQSVQPVPTAPLTGIVASHQAPFPASWFWVDNAWTGQVDGQYYTVYAGQKEHPSSGGTAEAGVVVYSDPANVFGGSQPREVGVYLSATGASPLRIVSVHGALLYLVSSSGQLVTFNVSSKSFGGS
jgi:hypothetical protein